MKVIKVVFFCVFWLLLRTAGAGETDDNLYIYPANPDAGLTQGGVDAEFFVEGFVTRTIVTSDFMCVISCGSLSELLPLADGDATDSASEDTAPEPTDELVVEGSATQ